MPTLEHNALIEMFRENPALAPHFLAIVFHANVPFHKSVRVADSALDQLIPVEFRADLVLELCDEKDKVVFVIVLEAQREADPRKKYTWPVYWAVSRAERECPAVVLVIAPDNEVAVWAAETIDLGLGLNSLQVLVLGPATLPLMTDPEAAAKDVELAVLSAMAHGNGAEGLAVVQTALVALGQLDREHAAVYFQIIWNMLREPIRRALEALIMQRQTEGKTNFPPFAQKIFEQGEHSGELKGKREALFRLLARAGMALTEDDRGRVLACTDSSILDGWIDNVIGAKSASDVLS